VRQPCDQKHFTVSEVAADWREPVILYVGVEVPCAQGLVLKRVSRLFITRTSNAEHTVDRSREISTSFQHGLECIISCYTRMIHSGP